VMRLPRRVRHADNLSFVEHLEELRLRLIVSLVAVAVALVATYAFRKTLIGWLNRPLPEGTEPVTLSPVEPFMTSLTVAVYGALAVSLPILLWQLWSFLAPAFEEASQAVVARLVLAASLLFAAGMAFAYWVVLPNAMPFLLGFDSELYDIELRAREYYGFAATTIFLVGLLFELPIFILGLVRLGILTSARLRSNRRIGYGVCVIAAVLLPGVDFVTMALQILPIVALFEGSIWLAVLFERRWAAAGVISRDALPRPTKP
jgi:sec-independent protein translocase protein TatC